MHKMAKHAQVLLYALASVLYFVRELLVHGLNGCVQSIPHNTSLCLVSNGCKGLLCILHLHLQYREVTNASNSEFWRPDQFYMDWRVGQEPPSTEDVVESPYPAVHLRTILSLHSIGHFIRDNLAPLTSVPTRFGVDPKEFTWVRRLMRVV